MKSNYKVIYLRLLILLSTFVLLLYPKTTLAHPGGTDSNGGHYNRSTDEYHYHHGYSAHQHPNGICPYNNINSEKDNISSNAEPIVQRFDNLLNKSSSHNNKSFDITDVSVILIIVSLYIVPSLIKYLLDKRK